MKPIICLAACALVALLGTGCGADATTEEPAAASDESEWNSGVILCAFRTGQSCAPGDGESCTSTRALARGPHKGLRVRATNVRDGAFRVDYLDSKDKSVDQLEANEEGDLAGEIYTPGTILLRWQEKDSPFSWMGKAFTGKTIGSIRYKTTSRWDQKTITIEGEKLPATCDMK